jgi:AraC family transcriptional regulator
MRALRERGRFFGTSVSRRQVGDLLLVDSLHAAGSHLPKHSHDHAYFCVNHGGTYTEDYGRRRRSCTPGMLVFHPPGETHRQVHDAAPVASLNVEVGATWLRRIVEFAGPLDQPAQFAGGEIPGIGLRLLREFQRPAADSDLVIESLCWEILAASQQRKPATVQRGRPRWLLEAHDLLDARLNPPPTVRAMAQAASVHPVHFAATFRHFYGCSVGEYLRRERLRAAHRKLADLRLSWTEIAIDCGFTDQSHFTRTFKRFTGMTPGAYRTLLPFKTR